MFLRRKCKRNKAKIMTANVDDIYVATSNFKASCNEGNGFLDKKVKLLYLVITSTYGYKELFSGRELVFDETEEFSSVPFIQKIEPLRNYLGEDIQEEITYPTLFDIITTLNAMAKLEK